MSAPLTLVWRNRTIRLEYNPDWLGMGVTAHLEFYSELEHAPLPITQTGYRSHFLPCGVVEAAGGPEAFATMMLDEAAQRTNWEPDNQLSFL